MLATRPDLSLINVHTEVHLCQCYFDAFYVMSNVALMKTDIRLWA